MFPNGCHLFSSTEPPPLAQSSIQYNLLSSVSQQGLKHTQEHLTVQCLGLPPPGPGCHHYQHIALGVPALWDSVGQTGPGTTLGEPS